MLSLSLNYIFYKADIEYWLEYRRICQIESTPSPILNSIEVFHDELIQGALTYFRNETRLELPGYEDLSFWERFKKSQSRKELTVMSLYYTDNDSFLFLELLNDAINRNDKEQVEYLKNYFDSHVLNLPFNYTAQAMQANISIKLYQYSKEEKYKIHAGQIYRWLLQQETEFGILYIKGMRSSLVDVLGVIIPFLVEYSNIFNCPKAKEIALKQIEIYTKYGCDKETGMPAFAYSIKTPHIKVGLMNWGRGISWYVIGLSCINLNDLSFECQETIRRMNDTLSEIWNKEHQFGHFVYDHDGWERDLTAELPIIWYLNKNGYIKLSNSDILQYSQYMHDGIIYNCSNGNSGAIRYGVNHGPMMLGQAFALRLTNKQINGN